jgi:small subunit ribosomal protein S17
MPKRVLTGTVVSDKAEKTVVVRVERRVKHPLYGKIIRLSKKYHAHDAANEFHVGEVVRIEECAPISKLKTWKVVDRIGAAKAVAVEINEPELVAPVNDPSKAPAQKPAEEKPEAEAEEKAEKTPPKKPAKKAKTKASAEADA